MFLCNKRNSSYDKHLFVWTRLFGRKILIPSLRQQPGRKYWPCKSRASKIQVSDDRTPPLPYSDPAEGRANTGQKEGKFSVRWTIPPPPLSPSVCLTAFKCSLNRSRGSVYKRNQPHCGSLSRPLRTPLGKHTFEKKY